MSSAWTIAKFFIDALPDWLADRQTDRQTDPKCRIVRVYLASPHVCALTVLGKFEKHAFPKTSHR